MLQYLSASFSGTDAHNVIDIGNKYFTVTNIAGGQGIHDLGQDILQILIPDYSHYIKLGKKVYLQAEFF